MDKPLVSVIVPVYNVENYLVECIESVINQLYRNLEIILVDDGSTDKSGIICDEYSEIDERIIVIHKENEGLSSARNIGVDIMKGDYLTFLDSDDYLDESFVNKTVESIDGTGTQIIITDCVKVDDNRNVIDPGDLLSCDGFVLSGYDAYAHNYKNKKINRGIACAKLYSRDLFEGIRYPVGKIHEDEYVTYKLFSKSQRVCYIGQGLYNYRVRVGSIMNTELSSKNLTVIDAFEERIEFFGKEQHFDCRDEAIVDYGCTIADWAGMCDDNRVISDEVYRIFKDYRTKYFHLISFRLKLGIIRRILIMRVKLHF